MDKDTKEIKMKELLTNDAPTRVSLPTKLTLHLKNMKDGDKITIPVPKMTFRERRVLRTYLLETYPEVLKEVSIN